MGRCRCQRLIADAVRFRRTLHMVDPEHLLWLAQLLAGTHACSAESGNAPRRLCCCLHNATGKANWPSHVISNSTLLSGFISPHTESSSIRTCLDPACCLLPLFVLSASYRSLMPHTCLYLGLRCHLHKAAGYLVRPRPRSSKQLRIRAAAVVAHRL